MSRTLHARLVAVNEGEKDFSLSVASLSFFLFFRVEEAGSGAVIKLSPSHCQTSCQCLEQGQGRERQAIVLSESCPPPLPCVWPWGRGAREAGSSTVRKLLPRALCTVVVSASILHLSKGTVTCHESFCVS